MEVEEILDIFLTKGNVIFFFSIYVEIEYNLKQGIIKIILKNGCKKLLQKVFKKFSNSCQKSRQKVVKKLSKSWQKVSKKVAKSFPKVGNKL
jgi:hypothetical protein